MDEGINGSLIWSRKTAAKLVRKTTFALIGCRNNTAVTNQEAGAEDMHEKCHHSKFVKAALNRKPEPRVWPCIRIHAIRFILYLQLVTREEK